MELESICKVIKEQVDLLKQDFCNYSFVYAQGESSTCEVHLLYILLFSINEGHFSVPSVALLCCLILSRLFSLFLHLLLVEKDVKEGGTQFLWVGGTKEDNSLSCVRIS